MSGVGDDSGKQKTDGSTVGSSSSDVRNSKEKEKQRLEDVSQRAREFLESMKAQKTSLQSSSASSSSAGGSSSGARDTEEDEKLTKTEALVKRAREFRESVKAQKTSLQTSSASSFSSSTSLSQPLKSDEEVAAILARVDEQNARILASLPKEQAAAILARANEENARISASLTQRGYPTSEMSSMSSSSSSSLAARLIKNNGIGLQPQPVVVAPVLQQPALSSTAAEEPFSLFAKDLIAKNNPPSLQP